MIDLDKIDQNKIDERYIVPVIIDRDYTYKCAKNNEYVDLTVEIGDYAGMVVRVPTGGLGLLLKHNQRRITEFHYDYTITKMWTAAGDDKFDGRTITLDIKDQNFLHSLVFNFFDNIKKGNVQGLRMSAG